MRGIGQMTGRTAQERYSYYYYAYLGRSASPSVPL
jgi:hypothetical protein